MVLPRRHPAGGEIRQMDDFVIGAVFVVLALTAAILVATLFFGD